MASIVRVRALLLPFLLAATGVLVREVGSEPADSPSNVPESHFREFEEWLPTEDPEPNPNGVPGLIPIEVPKASPESSPSEVPEAKPSEVPEAKPSEVPEAKPSEVPEASPSEVPEASPSEVPESCPSEVPETSPPQTDDPATSQEAPGRLLGSLVSSRLLYVNVSEYPGEDCSRLCVAGQRRICYFRFVLEHYQAMGVACRNCARGVDADCERPQCLLGDGIEKGVMSINRQVPGPPIQVCKDDVVVVDVANQAGGTAASIHWHGLHMRDTPHMDGVPFVTQCPIPFSTTFRYQFEATEPGTHFYHSHSGHHRVNGQFGALVVRQPPAEQPNRAAYDHDLPEHYILISDWMHPYGEQLFPGLPSYGGLYPNAVLINGRGTYINPQTHDRTRVPPTRYYVRAGQRYRFRVINSVSHACPFQLQVQGHSLTVVASDSYDVEPRRFDTLVSNSGERYDFVLTADQPGGGDFWIRVRGMGLCETQPTEAFALLRYRQDGEEDVLRPLPSMPPYQDQYDTGIILNHPTAKCFNLDNDHCVTELQSYEQDDDLRLGVPDQRFFLAFRNFVMPNERLFEPGTYHHFSNIVHNETLVGAMNNLSLIFPASPPLTQPRDVDESLYCDDDNWPQSCADALICPCVHRLQIKLGSLVELVIVDEADDVGGLHHPFHLHGYRFMVTNLGTHPKGIPMTLQLAREMDRTQMLPRRFFNPRPPYKDTVSIPSHGFAVVRFRADNPGYWIMHCHYEWHLAIGMGLIVQVGRQTQMVSPPLRFPKCGSYQPAVRRIR